MFPIAVFDELPTEFIVILAIISTVYCIVLIDAVVETAAFFEVPLHWITARECSAYLGGALVGFLSVWYTFSHSMQTALAFIMFILISVCSVFQVKMTEDNRFPYQAAHAENTSFVRFGRSWHSRVEWVGHYHKLSPRQTEVLFLLAKGRNAKHIAETQCVSYSTAKSHIYSTYRKVGVRSQQELLDYIEHISLTETNQ
jgi:DNA-binding CsgD family transcriptional regulator